MMKQKIIIIGGGAAGFFAAITIAETNPNFEVIILEKSGKVLQKVKVSGGGRCNVTHACFTPKELIAFYPRGNKELLGPFHQFMTGDTMEWFENRGVPLKIEQDNRIFPESNNSQTIIDCLTESAKKVGVQLQLNQNVTRIEKTGSQFEIETSKQIFIADKLLIASGSNSKIWHLISKLKHKIIAPVPSLFTFNISDDRLKEIPGISVPNATVSLCDSKYESNGPLLVTHWGLSGPAILKLSAFGAIFLADKNYQYKVKVNWLSKSIETVLKKLKILKKQNPKKQIIVNSVFKDIPKRLWEKLVLASHIKQDQRWADISNKQLENLTNQLCNATFEAYGKTTFKEEFVTAGGIDLKEINFKRFESKLHKNLFFAGEVLNIDAITGGFNFQNAWTGGFIAGKSIAE
ncbi:MAG: NAD(P)/FAD-dependent oxidoreductase [Flavobacteriaceae bacterium]|nr:NAD(P)/FAD-dependent oxidoreductase [Flavobacteriaceae bacterium]